MMELHFELERETRGTRRYQQIHEGDGRPEVGTLYVTKDALNSAFNSLPDFLVVTIEEDVEEESEEDA